MPFTSWRTFTLIQRTGSSSIETQAGAEKDSNDHICSCAAAGAEADFPSQFARLNHVWPLLDLLQLRLRIFDVACTGAHASRQPCIAAAAVAAAAEFGRGEGSQQELTDGSTSCSTDSDANNHQWSSGPTLGNSLVNFLLLPYAQKSPSSNCPPGPLPATARRLYARRFATASRHHASTWEQETAVL